MLKEKNKDILKKLLEHILKVEITDIEINNIERNSGNLKIKRKHLDALLTTNEGKIGIEVNANNKSYVHPRNFAYICDTYASHTLVGEIYNQEVKIIQINFSYNLNDSKPYRIYRIKDDYGNFYVKNFIIYDYNMEYYKRIWYTNNERKIKKDKYLIMLDLESEELKKIAQNDKVVNKYMDELVNLNENPKFREYMTAEEDARKIYNSEMYEARQTGLQQGLEEGRQKGHEQGLKQGLKQGLEQGLEQGMEQGLERGLIEGTNIGIEKTTKKMVKNMLNENISEDIISKITGLSMKKINDLKNNK